MDWHSRPGSLCQARGTRSAASALLAANHTVSPVFSPQPLTPGCAWKSTSPSCLIFMSLLADALRTAALCFSRHPSCHGASGQLCARRWLSRPVRKCMNILCICGLLFGVGLELTPNFFFFRHMKITFVVFVVLYNTHFSRLSLQTFESFSRSQYFYLKCVQGPQWSCDQARGYGPMWVGLELKWGHLVID